MRLFRIGILVKINNVNEGFKKRQINYTESCPKYCWKEDYSEHGTDKLTQSNHLCGAELYQSTNPFFNLSSLHHSILGLHCYSFHVILIILDCSSTLTRTHYQYIFFVKKSIIHAPPIIRLVVKEEKLF